MFFLKDFQFVNLPHDKHNSCLQELDIDVWVGQYSLSTFFSQRFLEEELDAFVKFLRRIYYIVC